MTDRATGDDVTETAEGNTASRPATAGDTRTDWAAQILQFRRLHAVKQAYLAELLDVNQATVSRWETGRSIPDLSIQRRLRDMIHRTLADELLIKHCIEVSPTQVLLSTHERRAVVASAGYCATHGVRQDEIAGMDMTPTHGEESYRLWCLNRDQGFYRGEIASTSIVSRANSLTGAFRDRCVKVVITPVRLAGGVTMLRSERLQLTEADYPAALRANGGPIRIHTMDELVG